MFNPNSIIAFFCIPILLVACIESSEQVEFNNDQEKIVATNQSSLDTLEDSQNENTDLTQVEETEEPVTTDDSPSENEKHINFEDIKHLGSHSSGNNNDVISESYGRSAIKSLHIIKMPNLNHIKVPHPVYINFNLLVDKEGDVKFIEVKSSSSEDAKLKETVKKIIKNELKYEKSSFERLVKQQYHVTLTY